MNWTIVPSIHRYSHLPHQKIKSRPKLTDFRKVKRLKFVKGGMIYDWSERS